MKSPVKACFVLALALVGCAELRPWISEKEVVAEAVRLATPGLAEALDEQLPVVPPSRTRFPTQDQPPQAPAQPGRWQRAADGTFRFAPGSYQIPVMTWCMKASGSSPDAHRYTLSRLAGKSSGILRDLAARAFRDRSIRTSEIQYLSWKLQAGLTLDQMDARSRAIVAALLPEHTAALRRSAFEELRVRWNAIAQATRTPSFESTTNEALGAMGELGDAVRAIREARADFLRDSASYDTFRQRIRLPGLADNPADGQTRPWSELQPGVFARFQTRSHYMRGGVLEIRVLESAVAQGPSAAVLWASGERGAAGAGTPAVAVDISGLVADPGVSGVQPLAMSPLVGAMAVPLITAESPLVVAAFLAALAAAAVTDWDALAKALAAGAAAAGTAASNNIEDLLNELRNLRAVPGYIPPPAVPPAFPDLERAKPKTPVQGGGGLRKRWKDSDGNIYEWDGQHGRVEKYDPRGRHQGEYDANSGEQTKPKDPNRRVEP